MSESNLQELFNRARSLGQAEIAKVSDGGREVQYLIHAKDMSVTALEPVLAMLRPTPDAIRGMATMQTLTSLCDHAVRFKEAASAAFADIVRLTIRVIYDYHKGPAQPQWKSHQASWAAPLSPEFLAWSTACRNGLMPQADFANFIEDHIRDIVEPPMDTGGAQPPSDIDVKLIDLAKRMNMKYAGSQRLIELSRALSVRVSTSVTNAVALQSGEGEVSWAEEHLDPKSAAKLSVPGLFLIQIPIFDGGHVYRLPVRLRYRMDGNKVKWGFDIWQIEIAKRDAFNEAVAEFMAKTELPVFYGSPETKSGESA